MRPQLFVDVRNALQFLIVRRIVYACMFTNIHHNPRCKRGYVWGYEWHAKFTGSAR